MEARIDDFNALMEVVQTEAEDIFLDTASTVRGVRQSARRIAVDGPAPPSDDPAAPADGSGSQPDGTASKPVQATTGDS